MKTTKSEWSGWAYDSTVKLYTIKPNCLCRIPIIEPTNLKKFIKEHSIDSAFGFPESPGVITELPTGNHRIYGLHSREIGDFEPNENHPALYGNLICPENLFNLLYGITKFGEKLINGCVISIDGIKKNENYGWNIAVSPDHDLRENYPERFDDSLVESLGRTLSKYIESQGLSDKVTYSVFPKTIRWHNAPFSNGFWERYEERKAREDRLNR